MTAVTSGKGSRTLMAVGVILAVLGIAFLLTLAVGNNDDAMDAALATVLEETAEAHREYSSVYFGPTGDLKRLQKKTDLTIPEGVAVTIYNDFGSFCLEATKPETGETAHFESSVNEPESGPCD